MGQDAVDDGVREDRGPAGPSDGVDGDEAFVSGEVVFIFGGAVCVFDVFKDDSVLGVPLAVLVGVDYFCEYGGGGEGE